MIIEYLKLENFRQFKGCNVIHFSIDECKKATIVIAENTTGKTTLIESFSWVLYEKTSLKTIVNGDIIDELEPGDKTIVKGEICLIYKGIKHYINRIVTFKKNTNSIRKENTEFFIERIDVDGISRKFNDYEAKKIINEIIPSALFPYYFFKGEKIEQIGKEFSQGKNSDNSEFVKAIRGLLGFNWLYETNNNLKDISYKYSKEISALSENEELVDIHNEIIKLTNDKRAQEQVRDESNKNIEHYKRAVEEISEKIAKNSLIQEKKERLNKLNNLITKDKENSINLRKDLFKKLSSLSYNILAKKMIENTIVKLNNSTEPAKEIPGLEAKAIDYILNKKECLCGKKISEACPEYKALQKLQKYLPPNNVGYEMKLFNEWGKGVINQANLNFENLNLLRKQLVEIDKSIETNLETKKRLEEEMLSYIDDDKLKDDKIKNDKLLESNQQKAFEADLKIQHISSSLDSLDKKSRKFDLLTEQSRLKLDAQQIVNIISSKIDDICQQMEVEKRNELEESINKIFKSVFSVDYKLKIGESYDVKLISQNGLEMVDFENSTSQEAIMAFSFIGGIIDLARKSQNRESSLPIYENELEVEPYPLVMDAPSSSFDIQRIEKFCEVMPKIAEQVIFFIKDTDGKYVKEYLDSVIGKEYVLEKVSKYQSNVRSVK